MDKIEIYKNIKSAFCGLIDYKERGDTIEVITPFSTLNNKFISIFITNQNGKYIISDGGWIEKEFYSSVIDDDAEEILNRVFLECKETYEIRTQKHGNSVYYYKTCKTIDSLPSDAFDLANFISAIVNSRGIRYSDEREVREKEKFRSNVNDFLKTHFKDHVSFQKTLDDFPSIKFNAIVEKSNSLYLITYITGSTPYYFENALRRSIVNFEIADKSFFKSLVREKIALINDEAYGFNFQRSSAMIDLLRERSSKNINWSNKERLLNYI